MSERELIPAGTHTMVRGVALVARPTSTGCVGCAFEHDDGATRCREARLLVYPAGTRACGTSRNGIIWKPIIRVTGTV